MAKYRNQLPQLSGDFFLTDGGIETTLIFHEGLELPDFAAFHLLKDKGGYQSLSKYFRSYHINVLGGCCGTDHRHIDEICRARVAQ